MKIRLLLLTLVTCLIQFQTFGETKRQQQGFLVPATIVGNDTILLFKLPTVYVFPKNKFKNRRDEESYWRLVRDVKRTLPLAKMISQVIVETNDTLMKMTTKRERDKYMKGFEKTLYSRHEKEFKKMTYRQGKLLIRLVDRECEATSYELIKAYRGSFTAGFYQAFATLFGASLKSEFGSNKDDKLVEQVILMVESGQL